MNKRIKELAVEAKLGGANFGKGFTDTDGATHNVKTYYVGTEETFSRFAELIVKECLAQVDKVDTMLDDDKEKTGVAWVGLAIAKHFGVEE